METKTQDTEAMTYRNALILGCWSSNSSDNADCDMAIIELTDELISLAERRCNLLQSAKSRDEALFAIQFDDCVPDFFSLGDVLEELYDTDEFQQDSRLRTRTISVPAALCQPVGVAWMEINTYGCSWHAIPGDDDLHISTNELTGSVLRDYWRQGPDRNHVARAGCKKGGIHDE